MKIAGISSKKLGDFNEGLLDNRNLYNDKELIDEGELDWYDYGFRNYDPQIGRFPQLDPLTHDYPELTNYQYASNDPIANIDLDGLEGVDAVFQGAKNALQQGVTAIAHPLAKAASVGMSGLSMASLAINAVKIAAIIVNSQIASQTLNQGLSNIGVQKQLTDATLNFYEQHKNEMSIADLLVLAAHTNNYFKGLNLMAWWARNDFIKLNRVVINNVNLQPDVQVQIVQAGIEDSQEGFAGIMREGANTGIFISGAGLFPNVGAGPKAPMFNSRIQQGIVNSRAVQGSAKRFVSKIPANSKASVTTEKLSDGGYLFSASSPGRVPGSRAIYQKWINSSGQTVKYLKTTFGPTGNIIHIKPK